MPSGRGILAIQSRSGAASSPDLIERLVDEATAAHRYARALAHGDGAVRDVADAVHGLCLLHGHHPGVIDHILDLSIDAATRVFLGDAASGFAEERAMLSTLAAAAGPIPSTPAQAQSEAAITGQRHALAMLVRSDRNGCALGAVIAFLLDWQAVRVVIAGCARRIDLTLPAPDMPDRPAMIGWLHAVERTPALERAMAFGAQQLLAQQLGMWDLLEARQLARDAI